MKNIIKIFILAFVIGLSGCTGFYVGGSLSDGYSYYHENKYSIYNPYYQPYHTVTVIKPTNYGYGTWHNNHHHHNHNNKNNKNNNNNNQHYGHRTK